MSTGLVGDLDALEQLAAYLDGLPDAAPRVAAAAAPQIQARAREGYAANRGPNGEEWPANTSNSRYPSLARPASGVTFTGQGAAIRGEGEDVLEYHQRGNERLPKRAVFPDEGSPVPEAWAQEIDRAAAEEIERGRP